MFSKTQIMIVLETKWFILVILIKFGEIMGLFEIKQSYIFFQEVSMDDKYLHKLCTCLFWPFTDI